MPHRHESSPIAQIRNKALNMINMVPEFILLERKDTKEENRKLEIIMISAVKGLLMEMP